MKINYNSLPNWADRKEVKNKLTQAKNEHDSYEYDLQIDEKNVIKMEFNYYSCKWDCVAVYMNGYKVAK